MDPLCHTLVGASLARSGLGARTSLATAALVLGANAPDVDAITYVLGESLYWRRGWTHGVLALAFWPFVLTGLLLAWSHVTRGRSPTRPPPATGSLLMVSLVGVLTHPALDFMNNYGVRWLLPFERRWFYGDALFIVDPLISLTLAAGLAGSWWLRRDARSERPAQVALAMVTAYTLVMLTLGQVGPTVVAREFRSRGVQVTGRMTVSPVLGGLSRRYVVADDGRQYYVAGFRWWPAPRLDADWRVIPHGETHPAVAAARLDPHARGFVGWARFPFYVVREEGSVFQVTMDDARYSPPDGLSWAAVRVTVKKAGLSAAHSQAP